MVGINAASMPDPVHTFSKVLSQPKILRINKLNGVCDTHLIFVHPSIWYYVAGVWLARRCLSNVSM
jgi:hypothetical protein